MPPAKRHNRGRHGNGRSKRPKRRPPKKNGACKESMPAEWLHDWELSDHDTRDRRPTSDVSTSEMLESVSELMKGVDFASPTMDVNESQAAPPEAAAGPRQGSQPFIRATTLPGRNTSTRWPVTLTRPRDSIAWSRELRRLSHVAQQCSDTLAATAAIPIHHTMPPQNVQEELRDCADELESVIQVLRSMSGGASSPWRTRDKAAASLKMARTTHPESGESGGEADESGCESDVASNARVSTLLMEHTSALYCSGIICRDKESFQAVQDGLDKRDDSDTFDGDSFATVWRCLLKFVQDQTLKSLRFPPMGRDDRRRIHLLAKTFGLHSHSRGAGSTKAPVLSKTASTGIPPDAALSICEQQWTNPEHCSVPTARTHHLAQATSVHTPSSAFLGEVVGGDQAPLNDDNLGHQLLVAMGWQPGQGLGHQGTGTAQPVSAVIRPRRVGLGAELA
eukprot:TRINITY_DN11917_c3_g5_i5.p1 TRINITY_DN11917_c3_g5~~TRINITY_DN11917_c3_g5_i5.p1  ORF type:complete len:451 (+),score=62.15 TRINITY_DN11917_c3_g5_i5:31-1383(+)